MKERFPTEEQVDGWLRTEVDVRFPNTKGDNFEYHLAYAYKEARRILASVNSALLDLENKEKTWRGR